MGCSGLPGNRVEAYRAGMTPISFMPREWTQARSLGRGGVMGEVGVTFLSELGFPVAQLSCRCRCGLILQHSVTTAFGLRWNGVTLENVLYIKQIY